MARQVTGLVLAAGRGTRFATEAGPPMPKVLRSLLGRPMVSYVLQVMNDAGVGDVTVIIGFGADQVRQSLGSGFRYALQAEQKGSGHAVACARDHLKGFDGDLVVMCGDSPLFSSRTLQQMIARHRDTAAAVTLAAAALDDPTGYGRIVRSNSQQIVGIVEEKCATEQQRAIKEVNGGAYVFDVRWLFDNINQMAVNEAGEYNLTDMVRVASEQERIVSSVPCGAEEIAGVNTPEELRAAEAALQARGVR